MQIMDSFGFPTMLKSNSSNIIHDKEAVISNLNLILNSEKQTLFGDPYFGCDLKKVIFEQPGSIIVDLLIDRLYTTITTYIPQLYLTRKDIKIYMKNKDVYAQVKCTYMPDNTSDMYAINLTQIDNF